MSESLTLTAPVELAAPVELRPPPAKSHRHRRSRAISGDFDMQDFELLPPPSVSNVGTSRSVPTSLSGSPIRLSSLSSPMNVSSPINMNLGSPLRSSPRIFISEDAHYTGSSPIPDAVINLDDVFDQQRSNRTASMSELEPFCYPKHSLMCSPKKSDTLMVEGISEEEDEPGESVAMAKSNSMPSATGSHFADDPNSSRSSASSSSKHTSQPAQEEPDRSARRKVRYQSYYTTLESTSPLATSPVLATSSSLRRVKTPVRSRSPAKVRFQERPNPFQYEQRIYDVDAKRSTICVGDASKYTLGESLPDLRKRDSVSSKRNSLSSYSVSRTSSRRHSRDFSYSPGRSTVLDSESPTRAPSPARSESSSFFASLKQHHRRSSSIISAISSRIHVHQSSVFSLKKESSVIESTTDDLMGLRSDFPLLSDDDATLVKDLGQPGPIVEVDKKKPLANISNKKKRRSIFALFKRDRDSKS